MASLNIGLKLDTAQFVASITGLGDTVDHARSLLAALDQIDWNMDENLLRLDWLVRIAPEVRGLRKALATLAAGGDDRSLTPAPDQIEAPKPDGYAWLPDGESCKCIAVWTDGKGRFACCGACSKA